jgi:hypothetical protein
VKSTAYIIITLSVACSQPEFVQNVRLEAGYGSGIIRGILVEQKKKNIILAHIIYMQVLYKW